MRPVCLLSFLERELLIFSPNQVDLVELGYYHVSECMKSTLPNPRRSRPRPPTVPESQDWWMVPTGPGDPWALCLSGNPHCGCAEPPAPTLTPPSCFLFSGDGFQVIRWLLVTYMTVFIFIWGAKKENSRLFFLKKSYAILCLFWFILQVQGEGKYLKCCI